MVLSPSSCGNLSYVIGSEEEFSTKVTDYRNRLTHGNLNYDELDHTDIFWKCKDLQLIYNSVSCLN